jgi:hypothetical protein
MIASRHAGWAKRLPDDEGFWTFRGTLARDEQIT